MGTETEGGSLSSLLARIDERTKLTNEAVAKLETTIQDNYVTRLEFAPVKAVVYGMVGLILMAVLAAVITLVVIKQS